MPGVNVRFTRELRCDQCGELLALPGQFATLDDENGAPLLVNDADPPESFVISLECPNAHRSNPLGCKFEYWFMTPKKAQRAPGRALARI